MSSNLPLSEHFRIAAEAWADADAAASMLEECKTAVLSQRMAALGEMPVNRAELTIKSSPEWEKYLNEMVAARAKANKAKVQMEYLRMKFSEWQSAEASKRAEMRL